MFEVRMLSNSNYVTSLHWMPSSITCMIREITSHLWAEMLSLHPKRIFHGGNIRGNGLGMSKCFLQKKFSSGEVNLLWGQFLVGRYLGDMLLAECLAEFVWRRVWFLIVERMQEYLGGIVRSMWRSSDRITNVYMQWLWFAPPWLTHTCTQILTSDIRYARRQLS